MSAVDCTHSSGRAGGPERNLEPLAARVSACLVRCRAWLPAPAVSDHALLRLIRRPGEPVELGDVERALRRIARDVDRAVQTGGGADQAKLRQLQALRAEVGELQVDVQQALLDLHSPAMTGVRTALAHLAGIETTGQMMQAAPAEVCRALGVDRCAIFRTDGTSVELVSVHFAQDDSLRAQFESFAREHPVTLTHHDPEVRVIRHRVPIIVEDLSLLDGGRELAQASRTTNYAVSPIVVRGAVVGLIHADRYCSGRRVDPVLREALGAFSAGFGYALERNALIEGTRTQLAQIRSMLGTMEDAVEARLDPKSIIFPEASAADAPAQTRVGQLLTRRELEVIELMSQGASNSEIAAQLVISPGTVKSHVKHILRKLRAANRAQAVSAYTRVKTMSLREAG